MGIVVVLIAALLSLAFSQDGIDMEVLPNGGSEVNSAPPTKPAMFTKEELVKYDGTSEDGLVYVSVMGHVFDVTKGKKHYGKDGSYGFFAGVDASKSYVTGKFDVDLTDDVTGFTPKDHYELNKWLDFYLKSKDYFQVGKLEGFFFDANGELREGGVLAAEGLAQGKLDEEARKAEIARWPNCNSKWAQGKGGEVWCKDPEHVPRLTAANRCACMHPKEATQHGELKVYKGCSPLENRCKMPEKK